MGPLGPTIRSDRDSVNAKRDREHGYEGRSPTRSNSSINDRIQYLAKAFSTAYTNGRGVVRRNAVGMPERCREFAFVRTVTRSACKTTEWTPMFRRGGHDNSWPVVGEDGVWRRGWPRPTGGCPAARTVEAREAPTARPGGLDDRKIHPFRRRRERWTVPSGGAGRKPGSVEGHHSSRRRVATTL